MFIRSTHGLGPSTGMVHELRVLEPAMEIKICLESFLSNVECLHVKVVEGSMVTLVHNGPTVRVGQRQATKWSIYSLGLGMLCFMRSLKEVSNIQVLVLGASPKHHIHG